MSSSSIVDAAQSGFRNADLYDRHRPSYSNESVSKLLKNLGVDGISKARILDLAAGTGKFTELLAAREEDYEVIAVEPHKDMRETLQRKALRNVKVVDGTSTQMSAVEDGWADSVVIAQAFHWFANMESLREIHRVLAPGGTLGLIWNVDDYNSRTDWKATTVWEGKLKDIIWSHPEKDPRYRHNEWPKVFDEQLKSSPLTIQSADPLFSLPLGEDHLKWGVRLSKEGIWDRFRTISHVSVLEGQQLEDTKKKAFEAMGGEDAVTNETGEIELHGITASYWTTAIPGAPLKSGG